MKTSVVLESAGSINEDRADVIEHGAGTVLVVADGAGGIGGGAEAADLVLKCTRERLAEAVDILGKQFFQTVMILLAKPLGEGFEFSGFGIVVAAGVDEPGEFGIGYLS